MSLKILDAPEHTLAQIMRALTFVEARLIRGEKRKSEGMIPLGLQPIPSGQMNDLDPLNHPFPQVGQILFEAIIIMRLVVSVRKNPKLLVRALCGIVELLGPANVTECIVATMYEEQRQSEIC